MMRTFSPYIMERLHSNAAVNRAGDFISGNSKEATRLFMEAREDWSRRFDEAFDIVTDWRNIHGLMLKEGFVTFGTQGHCD